MQLVLSALGPSISEQLENNGLEQTGTPIELIERFHEAITLLHIHGLLSDSECNRSRKRLIKKVKVRKVMSNDPVQPPAQKGLEK